MLHLKDLPHLIVFIGYPSLRFNTIFDQLGGECMDSGAYFFPHEFGSETHYSEMKDRWDYVFSLDKQVVVKTQSYEMLEYLSECDNNDYIVIRIEDDCEVKITPEMLKIITENQMEIR